MPLVDRADSTLVVVDAQRVFFDQRGITEEERAQGAAYTTGDVEHRRGLEQMLRAGVEILHGKGVAFEWLRIVEDATRTLRAAEERYGPPPLRL